MGFICFADIPARLHNIVLVLFRSMKQLNSLDKFKEGLGGGRTFAECIYLLIYYTRQQHLALARCLRFPCAFCFPMMFPQFFFFSSVFLVASLWPLLSPLGAYVCFGDGECGRESCSELAAQRPFNSPPCCIPNCGSARL